MKIAKAYRTGFTLIELLAVLAIMIILASVVVASYIDLTRGAAMRSAVAHVRATMMLGRQTSIMESKRIHMVFDKDDDDIWYYVLVAKDGKGEGFGTSLLDEFADWSDRSGGGMIYNLDTSESSIVKTAIVDNVTGNWLLYTEESIWPAGLNNYGWEVQTKQRLPKGFTFKADSSRTDEDLVFKPDGSTLGYRGGGDYWVDIVDPMNPNDRSRVKCIYPTGFVSVDFK